MYKILSNLLICWHSATVLGHLLEELLKIVISQLFCYMIRHCLGLSGLFSFKGYVKDAWSTCDHAAFPLQFFNCNSVVQCKISETGWLTSSKFTLWWYCHFVMGYCNKKSIFLRVNVGWISFKTWMVKLSA